MGRIVAIGGMSKDMESINQINSQIISLSGITNPRLLYMPTANKDHEWYSNYIKDYFENNFGCKVNVMKLITEELKQETIREQILSSDIIFVEGGNSFLLLDTWGKYNVDVYLKEAYDKNILLSGISAGAICWFNYGHSSSLKYSNPDNWEFTLIKGLSFIDAFVCPHFNETGREESFTNILKNSMTEGTVGIGIDNDCALAILDKEFKVISENDGAMFHKFWKSNDEILRRDFMGNVSLPANIIIN